MKWTRAARTDKGVSAVGQVVSFNCVMLDHLEDKINAHLPEQIRVLGFTRTTKGFHAKTLCDRRLYAPWAWLGQ